MVGAFGEVSVGLNELVPSLDLRIVITVGLQKGREYQKGEMGLGFRWGGSARSSVWRL